MKILRCQMDENCKCEVTHIDCKGFIYCTDHGNNRKFSVNCRKLKLSELKLLKDGKQVPKY